jgi:hypothetical protein
MDWGGPEQFNDLEVTLLDRDLPGPKEIDIVAVAQHHQVPSTTSTY